MAFSGGTFNRAFHFARELVRRGHDLTLLAISPRRKIGFRESDQDGVRLVETPDLFWGRGRTGWDPSDALRRVLWLAGERYDVVHGWDCRPVVITPALFARRLSRKTGGVLFLDWCDWWGRGGTQTERPGWGRSIYGPMETFFEEAFRLQADGTTVISHRLRDRAIGLGVDPDRIWLVPQGCEIADWPSDSRSAARAKLGIAMDTPLILSVGVLLPRDAQLLFDAMRNLLSRNGAARLVLVGRSRLEIPADLAESGAVRSAGFVSSDELTEYMQACDVAAVPMADTLAGQARWPSRANAFLGCGRVVVMTRVSDLAARLESACGGYVTDPTPAAFAAGLERALDAREERISLESRGRELAMGDLAWTRLAGELEMAYRAVLDGWVVLPAHSGRSMSTRIESERTER